MHSAFNRFRAGSSILAHPKQFVKNFFRFLSNFFRPLFSRSASLEALGYITTAISKCQALFSIFLKFFVISFLPTIYCILLLSKTTIYKILGVGRQAPDPEIYLVFSFSAAAATVIVAAAVVAPAVSAEEDKDDDEDDEIVIVVAAHSMTSE